MKLLKNLAITGSLGLIAFAGLASATSIQYDQTLASVGDVAGHPGTPAPGYYNGTDNYAEHFATLTDGNLQLALRAGNRYNGPVITPNGNNYDYNSNPNTDPSKNWGVYYSIDTQFGGGAGTIGDYSYMLYFTDNTTNQSLSYNPIVNDDAYYDGTGVHGGASNNNAPVDQNAFFGVQNANWPGYFVLPSFDPSHTYTVTLSALSNTQGAVAQDLTIRVNGTPEPGTILTMLGSLGALGLFVRRRKA